MEDKLLKTGVDESGAGLYSRVVRGGGWVFLMRLSQKSLELGRLIVLARLLTENDFGLVGIALLMISTIETFTDTGFRTALVQKKEITPAYLDSAWTLGVIRAVFLFVVLFLVAPYGADFFGAQAAKPIIRVYGLIILIRGLTNIGQIYFKKELEFNKEFVYQLSGTAVDVLVSVSVALLYRTVWALVLGGVAGNAVRCVVSYIIQPYRPRLSFSWKEAGELWSFGKWILGSAALVFITMQGESIFVGRLLGAAALGFYQMAYKFSNFPAIEATQIISQVTFPVYSKFQGNIPRLREAYLKVLKLNALLAIPVAGGIFILAGEFTRVFLGDRWIPIIPTMQVLAVFGLFRAIGGTVVPLFMAVGRPKIITKILAGKSILLAMLIYPLTIRWGIMGAAMAVAVYALVFDSVAVCKAVSILKVGYSSAAKAITLPFLSTLITIAGIYALKKYVLDEIGVISFLLLVAVGTVIYLLLSLAFDRIFNYGSWQLVREQLTVLLGKSPVKE